MCWEIQCLGDRRTKIIVISVLETCVMGLWARVDYREDTTEPSDGSAIVPWDRLVNARNGVRKFGTPGRVLH